MDVVVRSCWLWGCFQEEACALQPVFPPEGCCSQWGFNLRGRRGNGDYVEKNWFEGVLVGVKISSGELWEAANGNIRRN